MMCFLIQNLFNNRSVLGWENAYPQFEKSTYFQIKLQRNILHVVQNDNAQTLVQVMA